MQGLMMDDYQLTLPPILRRVETFFGDQEVVTAPRQELPPLHLRGHGPAGQAARRRPEEAGPRARRPGRHAVLEPLPAPRGVLQESRAPAWSCTRSTSACTRATSPRRRPRARQGRHRRQGLLPLLDQFKDQTKIEHVIVVEDGYEGCSTRRAPTSGRTRSSTSAPPPHCFTSGTTGRCKASSTRTAPFYALGVATTSPLGLRVSNSDTLLPVVPMFHGAWGYPYLAAMIGTKLVFPGPRSRSLLEAFVQEKVTWTAGVPTIWLGMLQMLDAEPDKWDLSHMQGMLVGGSAVPRAMIAAYKGGMGSTSCRAGA